MFMYNFSPNQHFLADISLCEPIACAIPPICRGPTTLFTLSFLILKCPQVELFWDLDIS